MSAPSPQPLRPTAQRPTRPALAERYDRRRQQLVDAAARVLAAQGAEQTNVGQLTRELGLTPGALYHYFAGRDELLRCICDQLIDPLLDKATRELAQPARPADQLRTLISIWVEHVVTHLDHMLVFQQQRHLIDREEAWAGVRAGRKRFERLVDGVLAAVDDAGELRIADRRVALSALLGMVNHTAQWYSPRGRLRPGAIAHGYAELLLADRGVADGAAEPAAPVR